MNICKGLLVVVFLLSGISFVLAQPSFRVYNTKQNKLVNLEDIVSAMEHNHVLFFGEEHDDSIAHLVQDTLYKMLIDQYGACTLGLEMFERDCQLVLDEYLNGFISEMSLIREARAWNNYRDYAPLVNTAREFRQKVLATNAPRRYVSLVNRRGLAVLDSLGRKSRQFFAPLPIDTVNTPYFEKFVETMGGQRHFSGINMYYAQTLWDATMAYSIAQHLKKRRNRKVKFFHLNGRFHTDERLGIYSQLLRMNPRIKKLTISSFKEKDTDRVNWETLEHLGDFIIVTNNN